jgi:hypothetical protein
MRYKPGKVGIVLKARGSEKGIQEVHSRPAQVELVNSICVAYLISIK